MNIIIDLRMINASGIGTYIKNLVPLIIENYPSAHYILLGKKEEILNYEWSKRKNVTVRNFGAPIYSLSEQIKIIGKIPKGDSLFWSPHYNIPLLYRGKLIVTIHDMFHLAMPEYIQGRHKHFYAKFMFEKVAHKADRVLCISDFTRNELLRYVKIEKEKLRVIHLGINKSLFKKDTRIEDKQNQKPYLLYVGNVKPHKNLQTLIKAFEMIKDCIPHDLVIVGKKEGFITDDKEVIQLAGKLDNRVRFTGFIDERELVQHYSSADVFIFPSLYEGFGLPPLEAMACECPVIASNAASLPEVCGDAVLYIKPDDAKDIANKILLILSNNLLRETLIEKGMKHVKLFNWKQSAQEIISVINEVWAQ